MGQVPQNLPPYGIVGNGRVARHLVQYFDLLSVPYVLWRRGSESQLADVFQSVNIVLLLISDSSIEKFIDENPTLLSRKLIHFSGSHLSARVFGAHPLMTFSETLYDIETYKKIPFVIDNSKGDFHSYFPTLPNPVYAIAPERKGFYHSLCVLSGNFSTLLWQKVFFEFETKLDLPAEILIPYLRQTFKNLETSLNHSDVLSGPLKRGDTNLIRANLKALENDPYQKVYESFVAAYSQSKEKTHDQRS